jgi:hypothetical protein
LLERGWVARARASRALRVTVRGRVELNARLGIALPV